MILPPSQKWIYFEETVLPQIPDYMGSIFEEMCRYYLQQMSVKGAIGFTITKIGCWWGTNPKLKREEEIDIVGVNPLAKYILLGECKYQNQGIHLDTAKKLQISEQRMRCMQYHYML